MNFKQFISLIQKQSELMFQGQLFTVEVDPDLLWETYLNSFKNLSIEELEKNDSII